MSNCVLLIASEQHTKSCVGRGGEGRGGQGRGGEEPAGEQDRRSLRGVRRGAQTEDAADLSAQRAGT